MATIKGRNTAPELAVRRAAHRIGLRCRLYRADLPGTPDLVFAKYRLAVFVNGCFWHQHPSCSNSHIPKSNVSFWKRKFKRTVARDAKNYIALRALGWNVLVIWECHTRDEHTIRRALEAGVRLPHSQSSFAKHTSYLIQSPASGPDDLMAPTLPSFVDAFAGCGGLSLGLTRAGWRGVFAIEKDAFAFDTLSANFPVDAVHLSYRWTDEIERRPWDIHDLLRDRDGALRKMVDTIDLLAGGPPCQGVSHAGRRRQDDPRNKLFSAYLELIDILRPRFVLLENVQGFKTGFSNQGGSERNFSAYFENALRSQYDVTSAMIQADDYGVPQRRRRYFVVGALKSLGLSKEIVGFFDDLQGDVRGFLNSRQFPLRPTARDAISDLETTRNGTVSSPDTRGYDAIGYKKPLTSYQVALRDGLGRASPSDTRLARHRPATQCRFQKIIAACREEGRLSVSISAEVRKSLGIKKTAIRVLDPFSPAPTITSLPDDLLHYSEPRTLTVRENARLQSFPDWFVFRGNYTTGGHRRRIETPRFSQVANAVPPLVAEQLGLQLLRLLRTSEAKKTLL